jgi:sulfite reductase beta subunit-like hemoprotein
VSGCIRECAEAQGKDFGVIATDKGWNSASDIPRHLEAIEFISDLFTVFVGGNGGATPVGPVSDIYSHCLTLVVHSVTLTCSRKTFHHPRSFG